MSPEQDNQPDEQSHQQIGEFPQKEGPVSRPEFDIYKSILLGALVIVAIGFITIIVDVWNNKGASTASLVNEINQQNVQIQSLNDKVELLTNELSQQETVSGTT